MADAKKQERRRRELRQRESAFRDGLSRGEAAELCRDAMRAHQRGDFATAERMSRKALALSPNFPAALDLLSGIYFQVGRYADAAYYSGLLRKVRPDLLGTIYNHGLARMRLGRHEEALADFREFLAATGSSPNREWAEHRVRVAEFVKQLAALPKPEPARETAAPAAKPVAAPLPRPTREPAPPSRIALTFPPAAPLDFAGQTPGSLVDFFLRQRLLELRLAQNFEDLVCLPTLSGVDTYTFQQDTVRKVLRQFKGRALLADEVGLGKTIEACLVLKEYWARGMVRKALVLTPPSLVPQWKGELGEKFGFEPVSPDTAHFRQDPERFWREDALIVASVATARLDPHATALASIPWDMVIVDEAHCLKNRASANWKLVDSLQKKFILMLTATPVENNLVELYNLITVLKPGLLSTEAEFKKQFITTGKPRTPRDPEKLRALLSEVMVRNTRSVVDVALPPRIAATVTVAPSENEARLYEAVSAFVAARYKRNGAATTALESLQRQAGSSPQALLRSIDHALRGARWLDAAGRREMESIEELAAGAGGGEKAARLAHMLAGHAGKVVVFTEFIPTLDYLAGTMERHGIPCAVFSGELSRAEKDSAIARFRDEVDVLLSTGVGGEGRNLQFANTVINFDLPWNPMRLEQRVGRVHRIGQTRDVFVFNFCQTGTIEEQLLRVLHDKVNMFELVVGEIDAILGSVDEARDLSDLVLELWLAGRESGRVQEAFDELADTLLAAKKRHSATKHLEDTLFDRDFEV